MAMPQGRVGHGYTREQALVLHRRFHGLGPDDALDLFDPQRSEEVGMRKADGSEMLFRYNGAVDRWFLIKMVVVSP